MAFAEQTKTERNSMNDEQYIIIDTDEKRQKYAPKRATDELLRKTDNRWSAVSDGQFDPSYIYRRLLNQSSANHAWILASKMEPQYPCWIGYINSGGMWVIHVGLSHAKVDGVLWWAPIQTPPPRPSMEDSAFEKAWNGYTGHDRGLTPYHVAKYFFLTGAQAAKEAKP